MKRDLVIFTDELIIEPSHYHSKIDQTYLKEGLEKITKNFDFLVLSDYRDIGNYINRFIDDKKAVTLQESDMEDHETVDTDIAAIILPLAHADENALWHISYNGNINGFSDSVRRECSRFRDKVQMGRKAQDYFMQTFRIPVFESYKFLPGYRYENHPLGKDLSFEEMMPIVKTAYGIWLEKNFSTK